MKQRVAIMQPTYLPWLGYFDLMDSVDIFVYLDSVQFQRRSWQQRNRIKSSQGELMLSVPIVSKGKRDQEIKDVLLFDNSFLKKHLSSIHHAYRQAPYFDKYFASLAKIYSKHYTNLCELNIDLIGWISESLGIKVTTCRSSSLDGLDGHKVEYLISICNSLGVSNYVSPPGSMGYIEDNNKFSEYGITLTYHEYTSVTYMQLNGEFIPHLSAIDLLFNMGEESLNAIRRGRDAKR